ncbi:MAG TPA: uracil-DNA glycosylase [Solirubrobacterales bacterium]|nr:uracil-DNA glycosylase [Solirubrobacterales bacterium]
MADSLKALRREVISCVRCPRMVEWRERSAADPPRRYRGEEYWARPLPGFGDPKARIVLVGLAPAAHGGNRTGRIFTGDRSGDWLYAALDRAGLSNQPTSEHVDDGLRLRGAYVTAVNRCPPPENRPTTEERENCLPYLVRELRLLRSASVLVALGSFAWTGSLLALAELGAEIERPRPRFAHGAEARIETPRRGGARRWSLLGCFHPSQQNTFTGKLTEPMMDEVFARARRLAGGSASDT